MGYSLNKEVQKIFEEKFEKAIENEFEKMNSPSGVEGGLGSSRNMDLSF